MIDTPPKFEEMFIKISNFQKETLKSLFGQAC